MGQLANLFHHLSLNMPFKPLRPLGNARTVAPRKAAAGRGNAMPGPTVVIALIELADASCVEAAAFATRWR